MPDPSPRATRPMVSLSKARPLEDELRFLRGMIARPKRVGAIAPSSPALARAIAREVSPERAGPVLELGPGTGVVTQALIARGIVAERITAIEYDEDFSRLLATRFPKVHVVRGDAFDLKRTLGAESGPYIAIVSGVPLLNYSPLRRTEFVEASLSLLMPGAPFVQFSYGLTSPVAAPQGASVEKTAFVWRNLPPARVWVYRRS